jgi:hypothetical protein
LKAGGAETTGATYLGPTLQPPRTKMQIAAAQAKLMAVLRVSAER